QSRYFGYHGWNVLALDLPGHGGSAGPPLPTIEAMAHWVVEVLKLVEIEKASVIGHSMGSLIALEYAARHAAERIVLIGTAYPMAVSEAFLEAARKNEHGDFEMESIWGHAPRVALG